MLLVGLAVIYGRSDPAEVPTGGSATAPRQRASFSQEQKLAYLTYLHSFNKLQLKDQEAGDVLIDERRLRQYLRVVNIVQDHNIRYSKGEKSFQLKINHLADWLPEEIDGLFHINPPSSKVETFSKEDSQASEKLQSYSNSSRIIYEGDTDDDTISEVFLKGGSGMAIARDLSWASSNNPLGAPILNSVHNQGGCGACWAFVTASAVEAAVKLSLLTDSTLSRSNAVKEANEVPQLSAQELIDCDTVYNSGCNGGNPYLAANWIVDNGIVSSRKYPYMEQVTLIIFIVLRQTTRPPFICFVHFLSSDGRLPPVS